MLCFAAELLFPDYFSFVSVFIRAGLDEPDLQVVFFVIIFGDQSLGRLTGAHGTIFKIKLCHFSTSIHAFIIPKGTYLRKPLSAVYTMFTCLAAEAVLYWN